MAKAVVVEEKALLIVHDNSMLSPLKGLRRLRVIIPHEFTTLFVCRGHIGEAQQVRECEI